MNQEGCIRQIIVVTDGCSNQGESPALAAAQARKEGIVVNVIGVALDTFDQQAQWEIEAIARAGDGIAELVSLAELSQSMQVLTRRSMQMTVEKAIHRQLASIVGSGGLASVPPSARGKIVEMCESICEETPLQCLVLLDISGSMQAKLAQAEKSICELLLSLEGRKGEHLVAVATFPGNRGEAYELIRAFDSDIHGIRQNISCIKAQGNTPTGPAIRQAICLFEQQRQASCAEYVI